ncbi:MAG: hypothetical protein A2787_07525 [Omnitrophica WOR_2 bacterium RIFCSPHIGHO2_01_FULL_48_9]|nr:MAG: hypothetical protein A3D10_02885 [Omnitrophica WOR_2 bacterium RIFCSPHIGHO2_02_FULL_48_11]OGX32673.1 MAG: hypothetical protein A2787_07525 [Omnitrophica WOR_2 bacterium RIFCSPHIGHO2_01_FULL_48_9]
MRVADLAKELNTTDAAILAKLKALKLKAKGGEQELNSVVLSVLKSEHKKNPKDFPAAASVKNAAKESKVKAPEPKQEKAAIKISKKEEPKTAQKKTGKEKVEKTKTPVVKKAAKPAVQAVEKTEKVEKKPAAVEPPKTVEVKAPPVAAVPVVKAVEPVKPKSKISAEPFVTLKPLPKKRKRFPERGMPGAPESTSDIGAAAAGAGVESHAPESGQASLAEARDTSHFPEIEVSVPITIKDLATRLQQKPSILLTKLMQMGMLANINQSLGEEIVRKLATEFGFNIAKIRTQEQQLLESHQVEEQDPKLLKPRAPVVTFMGHVDHGKTSLLDKIRKSKIADSEHGGITQHIGAYSVQLPKGKITFLDTPGHEAFTAMRARGAHITDLVVLVVAADEGIMPQTEEALDHARAAEVPIVIALNKIDKKNADPDRVKKQLMEHGLTPEDWGGKTVVTGVSATTGEGIDSLLEMILLEAELLELKANPDKKASGIVVEAQLSRGRGAVADLIVQSGTLHEGDFVVVGPYYGKIKAMFDDRDRAVKEAGPSMPVQILGLPGVPDAGEIFYVMSDERQAREIALRREQQLKDAKLSLNQKITLEDLYAQIQKGYMKELNVILKADVQGSVEALRDSLGKIPSDEVKLKFIHVGVGDVNLSDVLLAVASTAIIMAFHVGIEPRAKEELERNPVDIRQYRIIYDAVNDIRNALEGLLEPRTKKKFAARVEIRQVFKLSRSGIVAGCYVQKGRVQRKDRMDIVRNGEVIFSGVLSSLKRFKDDVRDVTEGMECGITITGFDKIEVGDIIETYELEQITRKL